MPTALHLRRETAGIELRRGVFEIVVDGKTVGSIRLHEDTVEMPLEPGHHILQLRAGRYSSKARAFDVADGETAGFRCHGDIIWPTYVASLVKPDLAISLKRE